MPIRRRRLRRSRNRSRSRFNGHGRVREGENGGEARNGVRGIGAVTEGDGVTACVGRLGGAIGGGGMGTHVRDRRRELSAKGRVTCNGRIRGRRASALPLTYVIKGQAECISGSLTGRR